MAKREKHSIFDEKEAPLYTQIKKGTVDIRCPKCNGQVMVDSEQTRQLPIGFGFQKGDSRFRVDAARYKGWGGQCMKCHKRVFAWHTRSLVTKHPSFGSAKRSRKTPKLTRLTR